MAYKRLSKILDEFGRPIEVPVTPRPSSKYDAAQTSDENRKHWSNSDAFSARTANNPGVRRHLRNRSRYERDNDPYYGGLIRTFATDVFGTGPTLQSQIPDADAMNANIEMEWREWCDDVGLLDILLVAEQAKVCDGEVFMLLRTDETQEVPLNLQLIEAEQCMTPPALLNVAVNDLRKWVDGIIIDERGRPLRYQIMREHPGDPYVTGNYEVIEAANVIHWFRKFRPGQYRGVPECTAALPVGAQRRRWNLATLTAAEMAADFAVLVTSELPDGFTDDDLPAEFETININRGMITTLPSGGDAKQMRSEHPNQEYTPFKHELLKEMGRPLGMPFSVSGMDGSEHNYSSLRFERETYHFALRVERDLCRSNVLDRIFRAWYALARLIPGYLAPAMDDLPEEIPFGWYWPGFTSLEPLKESVGDTERLSNGTTTLQELLAENGQDWKVFLAQRGRERAEFIRLGLPLPKWLDPAADKTPSAGADAANNDAAPPADNNARALAFRIIEREAAAS